MTNIMLPNKKHIVCTECGGGVEEIGIINEGKFVCFHCWVSVPHEDTDWDDKVVLIKEM